jgi:hypothetical protein
MGARTAALARQSPGTIKKLRDAGVTCIVHSPPEIGFIESASIEMALIRMEQLMEISR